MHLSSSSEDSAVFPGIRESESDLADEDEDEDGTAYDRGSVDTTNIDVDEDNKGRRGRQNVRFAAADATSSAAPSHGACASLAANAIASTP